LTAILALALAHEALASHRAAVAKSCACGPSCGGGAKAPPSLRRPASSPALPAPSPDPAPCCCTPADRPGTTGALTSPLLAGDEEAPAGRGGGGSVRPGGVSASAKPSPPHSSAASTASDTAAYALHAATSYLLMLAVMTFNLGACAAVLGGLAAGHAAFSSGRGAATLGDVCCAPGAAALEADAAAGTGGGEEWDGPPGMVP